MKKHLLSQLHNLQEIKPDKQWKAESQEFLRTHISDGVKSGVFSKVMIWVKDFAKVSSQPAFALTAFVLILITGVTFFNPVFSDAKPDDSLYIARIISEKAQVNMTFNKGNRDKLSAQFATNHAKDITSLMNDPEFHEEEGSEDKIANLSNNFNKEINSAKESISSINEREKNTANFNYSRDNEYKGVNNGSDLDSKDSSVASEVDNEGVIFSADTKKDDKGLEINVKKDDSSGDKNIDSNNETSTSEADTATSTSGDVAENDETLTEDTNEATNIEEEKASSTLNELQSITNEVNQEGGDVNELIIKTLDDAQRLYNEDKFPEAFEKLKEAEEMLEGVSSEISDEPSVE
jgi:SLT domain-containing protein